jgi:hypothetical protein
MNSDYSQNESQLRSTLNISNQLSTTKPLVGATQSATISSTMAPNQPMWDSASFTSSLPMSMQMVSATDPTLSDVRGRQTTNLDINQHAHHVTQSSATNSYSPVNVNSQVSLNHLHMFSQPNMSSQRTIHLNMDVRRPTSRFGSQLGPVNSNRLQVPMFSQGTPHNLPQTQISLENSMDIDNSGTLGTFDPSVFNHITAHPGHRDGVTRMVQNFVPVSSAPIGSQRQTQALGLQHQPLNAVPCYSQTAQWTPERRGLREASNITHTTLQPVSPAQTALNSLPAKRVVYGPYSSRFTSLEDVTRFVGTVRWIPKNLGPIPSTDQEMEPFVQQIYEAIIDFSGFHDKIESRNKLNRLVAQRYSQEEIEARCWQTVVREIDFWLLMPVANSFQKTAAELHLIGSTIPVSVDPTMELRSPGRKEGRGEGPAAYEDKKKAREDRDLNFEERITEICQTVRVSQYDSIRLLST